MSLAQIHANAVIVARARKTRVPFLAMRPNISRTALALETLLQEQEKIQKFNFKVIQRALKATAEAAAAPAPAAISWMSFVGAAAGDRRG